MAYEMVMPYHLHMPSYFLETFTEYPYCGIYIPNGVGGCCLSRYKAMRRPDDEINKIQPSRLNRIL